ACSLIEVARVLAQERGKYCAPDHDVAETIGGIGAIPLTETFRTLTEGGGITCLLDPRKERDSESGDRIGGDFERESEFQLSGERSGLRIIDHIEVRDDAQNALCFLDLDLFRRNLFRGLGHVHRGACQFNLQANVGYDLELAWFKPDRR